MGLKTPIMLVTGSLGSGKTTLLGRILKDSGGRKLAVVMNEFGEIPIDSKIIQGENVQIVELAGGCVCCSMAGEFELAVREIIDMVAPDFIVVEATGLAEADSLVYEVQDSMPDVRLDSVVCVVDAYISMRFPHMGYITRTQLEAGDVILINKIDLVTTDEVKEVESQVLECNDTAVIFKTVGCDIDPRLLFGLDVEKHVVPLTHHGEAAFQSFTYTTGLSLSEDGFLDLAASLPPSVYRAKGLVRLDTGDRLFNYVVGRTDMEDFPVEKTQLVFIGRHLDEARQDILRRLHDCEVRHVL